jgi:hypothetical protein
LYIRFKIMCLQYGSLMSVIVEMFIAKANQQIRRKNSLRVLKLH